MSSGEIQVAKLLNEYNVKWSREAPLYELTTQAGGTPRMDFAIYDKNSNLLAYIEYQGVQHYKDLGFFGKQAREETDRMKKDYCIQKHIPLFEIKYDADVPQVVKNILSTLMLIPCQASDMDEGVTTIL